MEENLNSVNAEQAGAVDQSQTEQTPTTESVNEEVTTSQQTEDKVQQTPEENAHYAQIRRDYESKLQAETQKARQEARDEWIKSQGYTWNNKPITTEAEYNQALLEKQYQDKGIDPNIISEAVSNNPVIKQAQELLDARDHEKFVSDNKTNFLEWFEKENKRPFDVKKDIIPPEIWEQSDLYEKSDGKQGKSLIDAYIKYENASLKSKLAEFEKGQQTNAVNAKNAVNSTGSVKGQGNLPVDFIAKDVFEANKSDGKWMSDNYDLLRKSMKQWK